MTKGSIVNAVIDTAGGHSSRQGQKTEDNEEPPASQPQARDARDHAGAEEPADGQDALQPDSRCPEDSTTQGRPPCQSTEMRNALNVL